MKTYNYKDYNLTAGPNIAVVKAKEWKLLFFCRYGGRTIKRPKDFGKIVTKRSSQKQNGGHNQDGQKLFFRLTL